MALVIHVLVSKHNKPGVEPASVEREISRAGQTRRSVVGRYSSRNVCVAKSHARVASIMTTHVTLVVFKTVYKQETFGIHTRGALYIIQWTKSYFQAASRQHVVLHVTTQRTCVEENDMLQPFYVPLMARSNRQTIAHLWNHTSLSTSTRHH